MDSNKIDDDSQSFIDEDQPRRRDDPQSLIEDIIYSSKYDDDEYEYRHVTLPKPLLKLIPAEFFVNNNTRGPLRLLSESEWRGIGITQSLGWEHYEVHAPEPWVLLFRRPKDFAPPSQHTFRKQNAAPARRK